MKRGANLVGSALRFRAKINPLPVLSTMENSPSARAGILPGDQIVAVAGKSTLNMPIEDLNQLLRGQPNQRLALTIYGPSTKETKDYEMRREMIKIASVVDAKILNPGRDRRHQNRVSPNHRIHRTDSARVI